MSGRFLLKYAPSLIWLWCLGGAISGCGYLSIEELPQDEADSDTETEQFDTPSEETSGPFEQSTATFDETDTPDSTETSVPQDSEPMTGNDTESATETDTVTDASRDSADSADTDGDTDVTAYTNTVALRFNGIDEYLSMGDLILSGGTISFWLKTSAQNGYLVSRVKIGGSAAGEGRIRIVDGQLRFTIEDPAIREVAATAVVNDDAWHHVAFTFNPGMALFIDGNVQDDVDITTRTGFEVAGEIFTVGNNNPLDENYFSGIIDEMAMYSRALTESEIGEIWNSNRPVDLSLLPSATSLIHWWRLGDEDTSPLLTDLIGGFDATTHNMDASNFVADTP